MSQTQLSKSEKENLLRSLAEGKNCKKLFSVCWGEKIEVWNLVLCWIQNAEMEKNDLVGHVECALSSESDEIGKYFRTLGFNF